MAANKTDINNWLDEFYADEDLTHMLVVCDTFDYEDYPVFVVQGESVHEIVAKHDAMAFGRVMEVYSKNHSREAQLAEHRAFHYD